ncbi:alpha/beta hydrolase [Streptomyces sp. NPDC014894]|uniref:alpha/beta hydrolase n=1 Tax=unclassified Streptomyces TaxID=2593676 RepID=UPI0036FE0AA6
MAHRALPPWRGRTEERDTTAGEGGVRLGRPYRTRSAGVEPVVGGVVLLLPDGERESARGPSARSLLRVFPLGRELARAGRADGLVVHSVRYRRRGWNGPDAQLARDASRAADEAVRRYGDVPVCLAGHGFGGRAALHAADHPAVGAVLAMAPWLPDDGRGGGRNGERDGPADEPEPVKQLVGRQVLIVHGTNDARTDPDLSYRLAERAKKVNRNICRFEVHTDGNALRQHHAEVMALATDFVLGSLFCHPYARPVADALAAPPPLGLRMPLAAGFGKSLRP